MFTKQVPLNVAAIPLPDGSLVRFVRERSSLACIAVPHRSVPMFMCFMYRRMVSTWGDVASCSSAISMSCIIRKPSTILIHVWFAMPFMLMVATLYVCVMWKARHK